MTIRNTHYAPRILVNYFLGDIKAASNSLVHLPGCLMVSDRFRFLDRHEAGKELAGLLLDEPLVGETAKRDLLILSIPRGGVVVGHAIAEVLNCDHDVVIVKKVGYPGFPEMAIGAVAEDGSVVLDKEIVASHLAEGDEVQLSVQQAYAKVKQYVAKFRSARALVLDGKTVILTDDGIATGETMKAAIYWLKCHSGPEQVRTVIVAVPVCSPGAAHEIERLVDRLVCVSKPPTFYAVGQFYCNFRQLSDDEILAYLAQPTDSLETLSPE